MPDVRLKFNPNQVVSISPQEYTDLSRQGLVVEDHPSDATHEPVKNVTVKTVAASAPKPTSTTDKSVSSTSSTDTK